MATWVAWIELSITRILQVCLWVAQHIRFISFPTLLTGWTQTCIMQDWKILLFIIWIGCLLGISKTTQIDVEMWNWELLCNYSTSGQIVNLEMFPHRIHHYVLVEVKRWSQTSNSLFLDFHFFVAQAWSWAQCATHSTSSPLSSTGCPARRATRGRPTQPYTIFTGSQLGSSDALPLVSFGTFNSRFPPPLLCPCYLFLASLVL